MRSLASGAPAALPQALALAAVAPWSRDELEPLASPENREQRRLPDHAAALALIGMTIQTKKVDLQRDPVVMTFPPRLAAAAVAAAKLAS